MKIESILATIAQDVFQAPTLETAKAIFKERVERSSIKAEDKTKMLAEIAGMNSLSRLQRYTANALLKYEGLGTQL